MKFDCRICIWKSSSAAVAELGRLATPNPGGASSASPQIRPVSQIRSKSREASPLRKLHFGNALPRRAFRILSDMIFVALSGGRMFYRCVQKPEDVRRRAELL